VSELATLRELPEGILLGVGRGDGKSWGGARLENALERTTPMLA